MPTAKVDGIDIHYEEYGSGEPLFLVTGMGGVGAYWAPQIDAFAQRFRVIVHDQRGTGRSTHSEVDYTVDLLANDLLGLMDSLKIDHAHIVGHSTGGMMAQILAIRHPSRVRTLVLYGSRGRADPFTERAMGMRRDLVLQAGVAAFIHSTPIFLYPSWWIKSNHAHLEAAEAQAIARSASPKILASRIDAVLHHHQIENLHRIAVPTLVTCARDDFLTPPYYSEELAALIPNAQLAFVERGGHACSQTNPEEFNQLVLSFVSRGSA
ncbi:MAG: alpha/beta fold hydrolase [Bradyrhizobium sp.]